MPAPTARSRTVPVTRRAAMGGALAAAAATRARPADLSGVTLRIGTYKGSSPLVQQAAGLPPPTFQEKYAEFAGGNLITEAISAGALDFGAMSEIPPVFALVSGAKIKLVAVLKADVNSQVVLVPRDSPARGIADLKGKRVGYVRATTSHYFLLQMLRRAGLGFDDIQPFNLSPADGRAAFESGRLDAWAVYGFVVPLTIQSAGARVLLTADGYLSGNYVFAASPDAVADPRRRAAVAEHLKRLRAAYAWTTAHRAVWAAAQSRELGVDEALIRGQLDNATQPPSVAEVTPEAVASQQGVADAFAEAGVLPRRVDVAPLWDRGFNAILAGEG